MMKNALFVIPAFINCDQSCSATNLNNCYIFSYGNFRKCGCSIFSYSQNYFYYAQNGFNRWKYYEISIMKDLENSLCNVKNNLIYVKEENKNL